MKLPELKSKFKNRYAIRIIAGVLVVTLVATGSSVYSVNAAKAGSAATENVEETEVSEEAEDTEDAESSLKDLLDNGSKVSEKEIGKEETVYVIADNTGKEQKIIVSDHLINNDDKDTLEDASTLKDIENVKGDETFTQSGNKVTWQADGNDIFYQGTSESELPVTQKLTYYLDGKEVTPEELAGKSGEVTIRFDYTNNQKVTAKIDGKDEDIYVPFMAVSGMILGDEFSDIEVENGKVISDGSNNVVVGYALPGLKGSLTSSADVQNLINGAALASVAAQHPTETIAEIQTNHADEIAEAQQTVAAQLDTTITTQLGGAADSLATGVADTAKQVAQATAGEAAVTGAKTAAGDAAVLGAKAAAGDAAVLGAKAAAGDAAVLGAKAAAGDAAVLGAKAAAGTAAVSAAEQTKSTMAASIEQQSSGGYSLVTGARALANGTQSLADAVPALTSGVAQLKNGSAELVSNNQKLNDGVNALSDGTDAVIDGVDQLSDGAHQLADGIVTFNEEGIEKILNSYHGDIEPLMDRIQAVLDAGEDYQTYTDIADGVNGSIKFIYKTDAVKED